MSNDNRAFTLLIEEYKTLRDEVARFQNQQKQLIAAALTGTIAASVGVLANSSSIRSSTFLDVSDLLLIAPLVLMPVSLLFFETELSIYRAAYYSGIILAKRARILSGSNEVLNWESFRAKQEGPLRMPRVPRIRPYAKWLLFVFPSPLAIVGYAISRALSWQQFSRPYRPLVEITTALFDLALISLCLVSANRAYNASRKLNQDAASLAV